MPIFVCLTRNLYMFVCAAPVWLTWSAIWLPLLEALLLGVTVNPFSFCLNHWSINFLDRECFSCLSGNGITREEQCLSLRNFVLFVYYQLLSWMHQTSLFPVSDYHLLIFFAFCYPWVAVLAWLVKFPVWIIDSLLPVILYCIFIIYKKFVLIVT